MSTRLLRYFAVVLLSIACLAAPMASTPVLADEVPMPGTASGDLTLRGFGTLGIARSDTDNAQFVRDLSQIDGATRRWSSTVDSLIGVQAALRIDAHTEGVLQAISRYRYDGSYRPEITWAFLRRDLSPEAQLRIGRLGTEFYMLADSRLVGYANLTVRPPPDYYGPLIVSYFDGIDASAAGQMGDGLVRGKLFAGYAAEKSPFVGTLSWDLRGSPLLGGHLDYFTGPWQFRAGQTRIRFKHELPVNEMVGFDVLALAPELAVTDRWADFYSLGLVYDSGPLQVQGMLSKIDYQTASYENSRAGYVIGSYRLPRLTPYLGYSRVRSATGSPSSVLSPAMHDFVNKLIANSHSHQQTTFLGARWDLQPNVALKLQLDRVRGLPGSVFPVREPDSEWNGRMTVFSLAVDFLF